MLVVFWMFVGMLTGLLVAAVFIPPNHKDNQLPTPEDKSEFHTKTGCVKFKAEEVECTQDAKSLNFIASKV
jgi:hypothetical protein